MTVDSAASVIVLATATAVALGYAWGAAQWTRTLGFSRVATDGGSPFLGMGPMRAVYWALEPVAKLFIQLGISANAITFGCLLVGAAAGLSLALGHLGIGALVAAVAALGDALDGKVARDSNTASDAGEVLDAAVDRYGEFAFLGGLALFYRNNSLFLSTVLVAILGSFMVSYATAKAEALSVTPPRGAMRRAERAAYLIFGAAAAPLVSLVMPAAADAPVIFAVLVVGVVSNVSAAHRLARIAELAGARARVAVARDVDWRAETSLAQRTSSGKGPAGSSPKDSRA